MNLDEIEARILMFEGKLEGAQNDFIT